MSSMMRMVMVMLGIALLAGAVAAAGDAQVIKLVTKDITTWDSIDDGAFGSLMYQGDRFVFTGHGLVAGESYTLIGYNEASWIGDETIFGVGVADQNGNVKIKGGAVILTPYAYTTGEYAGQTGAKVWLVPTASMTGANLNWVNPDLFLYETSLIV